MQNLGSDYPETGIFVCNFIFLIAINRGEVDYTLTIVDYEVGIDRIDLRGFGVRCASQFEEIQDKGGWFEAITPEVNGAQLVLRINVNSARLTYI